MMPSFFSSTLPSQALRENFVRVLGQQQVLSSATSAAFLATPREAFVPQFYQRDETALPAMLWHIISAKQVPTKEYLEHLYRDEALVTQIDQRGIPTSSSSRPTLMARMLETLQLQPGMRVLEIGTGTGYNAALLAHLIGDPRLVTTIDRDEPLVQQARKAFRSLGLDTIRTVVGDGYQGMESHAPYDRMIATASVPTVPLAWTRQLRPGGRLVMELRGSLEGSGLILEQDVQGKAVTGSFGDEPFHFMPLLPYDVTTPSLLRHLKERLAQPCRSTFELPADAPLLAALKRRSFRWLLQWAIPFCQAQERISHDHQGGIRARYWYLCDPETKTLLRLLQRSPQARWQGSVLGDRPLWDDLQEVFGHWQTQGCPQSSRYRVQGTSGQPLSLTVGSLRLPLPSTDALPEEAGGA